jgi:Tfp pilus assembly protein PilN
MVQQINLYQERFRHRRDYTDARHLGAGLLLVALVLAGVSGFMTWRTQNAQARAADLAEQRDAVQQQLTTVRGEVEQARAAREPSVDQAGLRAELAAKKRLMEYLKRGPLANRDGFSGHLAGLARRQVDDLWLRRIALKAGGTSLQLAGSTLGPEQVPAFIGRLAETPAFQGHTFRTLRIERAEKDATRLEFLLSSDRSDGQSE